MIDDKYSNFNDGWVDDLNGDEDEGVNNQPIPPPLPPFWAADFVVGDGDVGGDEEDDEEDDEGDDEEDVVDGANNQPIPPPLSLSLSCRLHNEPPLLWPTPLCWIIWWKLCWRSQWSWWWQSKDTQYDSYLSVDKVQTIVLLH